MKRRSFIVGALATVAAGGAIASFEQWRDAPSPTTRTYGKTVLHRRRPASDAPNVVFVSIDDMNDWAGFLNDHPGTRTPNMDALAARSLVFEHAYCAAPICLPSRNAIMFGVPPYKSGVYDHSNSSRDRYASWKVDQASLVDDLWAAGYDAFGVGKVFHSPERGRWTKYSPSHFYRSADSIDEAGDQSLNNPHWRSPYDGKPIGDGKTFPKHLPDFGPSGGSPDKEPDGRTAAWAVDRLDGTYSRPFFLGIGFALPHEPWRLPQKFFDMHPLEGVVVPPIRPHDLDDLGPYARSLTDPLHIFERIEEHHLLQRVVQAYQAAISFADDRLGRVLHELASSPYADDTIVVLWSDHGYHLGEKMHLEKTTLWERATHVPFLLHVPGRFDNGARFEPPVSTMDVGPTVTDLCGAKAHRGQDARSLLPIIENPRLADDRPPITTWKAGNYAVRRGKWRYIRYATGERELYDHDRDPDEYSNLAGTGLVNVVRELDAFLPPA